MSEGLARELARLYHEYYANRLSVADYRYQRGLLLDSLLVSNAGSDDQLTQPRADNPELEFAPEPPPVEPRPPSRGFRWPYVAAACVVLLAAVVYFVTREIAAPGTDEIPSTAQPLEATISEPEFDPETDPVPEPEPEILIIPDVGQVLVEEFVERGDWRHDSIREFQGAWGRLPSSDRIVAKGAVWFVPLVDQLEYEISEALEFSDAPDEDERLHHLYQLAVNLGLPELAPDNWKPGRALSLPNETGRELKVGPDDTESAATSAEVVADSGEENQASASTRPAIEHENTCRSSQLQTRRRGCYDLLPSGERGPAMRVLPAGEVADGVSVAEPYAISVSEVSREDFTLFCTAAGISCPEDPWPGMNMPVVNVSWYDANAYCEWLSEQTGFVYRLPSNPEWEYAARGGATSDYPFGDEITPGQARFSSISDYDQPLPVEDRTTQRNGFDLRHVVGNVREWVAADAGGDDRVTRGGSYADDEDGLRLSLQQPHAASMSDPMTGFRVVREL